MQVDLHKIIADIKQMAARIGALKRCLRTTWQRPMADEQRELARLKRRVTELCVLRAHLRGRLHIRRAPRDHAGSWDPAAAAERIAARVALAYPAPEAHEETA